MYKILFLAFACIALSLAGRATAADGRDMFAVKGVGTVSCQRYLDARAKADHEYVLFAGYINGYMTAYNQLSAGTFDILPWQSANILLGMMASYCQKNPETNFAVATTRLISILAPDKLETASETIEARTEQAAVKIYQETLRRVQDRLSKLGYYRGPADGQFTTATRQALEKFQSEQGVKQTGLPDQPTLFALMLKKPPAN